MFHVLNIDKNECLNNNGNCSHYCLNENGGYRCSCKIGYKLENNGMQCKGKLNKYVASKILSTEAATRGVL